MIAEAPPPPLQIPAAPSLPPFCFNTLINVTGQNLKPLYLEARHETKYAWSTWQKSTELLDFKHKVDLHEGITKMWTWAQKQPNRERFVWPNYELNKGLYKYWKT